MKTQYLIYLAIFLPAAAEAQEVTPSQIFDRFASAYQTLNFSDVSPYVHSRTLVKYRETTSAVIKHAAERYGADAVVKFFQGTTLQDLQSFSDREYWAFVMASSLQFAPEKPIATIAPIAEFREGETRLFLVYPAARSLLTAPELGSFPAHIVYGFEQEQGAWKMTSFLPNLFETTLYWYLRQKHTARPS